MTDPCDRYIDLENPLKESTIHVGKLQGGRSPVEKKLPLTRLQICPYTFSETKPQMVPSWI